MPFRAEGAAGGTTAAARSDDVCREDFCAIAEKMRMPPWPWVVGSKPTTQLDVLASSIVPFRAEGAMLGNSIGAPMEH